MKHYRTLLLALLAVLALTVCALADGEGDEPDTDTVVEVADQTVEVVSDPDAPQDNDELFYEYMLRLAREQMTPARPTREPTRGVHEQEMGLRSGEADGSRPPANVETAGSKLNNLEKLIYDDFRGKIATIAAGGGNTVLRYCLKTYVSRTGTINTYKDGDDTIQLEVLNYTNQAEANAALDAQLSKDSIMNALLADCPYELYWFDKTSFFIGYDGIYTAGANAVADPDGPWLEAQLTVASAYGSNYTVVKPDRVETAVANAASIVTTNASKSDYEKLDAYKEAICDAVEYNHAALTANTPYGDPWQLIYAFDGDSDTDIVCEGYSKAFKYLCDLSTFEGDVQCYLVEGTMIGGTGAGAHMWNIVTLEGKNYLVDVTNCDGDEHTKTDALFLKGITKESTISFTGKNEQGQDVTKTYNIDFYATIPQIQWTDAQYTHTIAAHNVAYKYAEDTIWQTANPGILTLSTTDYTPPTIDYTAGPTDSNYSYCAEGTTLHLKPTSGTAYLILARYSSGKLVEVKVQEVSTECSIENMTVSTEWKIFSVDGMGTCVPQGAALPLIISTE